MKHTTETKIKISNRLKELVRLNPSKFITNKKPSKIVNCFECDNEMFLRPSDKNKFCSPKCRLKAIEGGFLKGKSGGYRNGSGRSKSGWYKGIFCNSSYELAWVIFSLENKTNFVRNTEWFNYTNSNNKLSRYYPDYKLLDTDEYIEIKGYKEKEFLNKVNYFPKKLIVLDEEKIKPILDFVKEKYGKDFISLYDGNPHKIKTNSCLICGNPAKKQYCSRICSGYGVKKFNLAVSISR